MEIALAILIVCLSAGGLAVGLAFGRGAAKSSCGGIDCIPGAACIGCARARAASGGDQR